jgi:HAMP domain-containing protein
MRLSITAKVNVVLVIVFSLGLGLATWLSNALLQQNAKEEVLGNARILMESAMAARTYTQQQITPLLQDRLAQVFLPQSVPSFAATENLAALRAKFSDFYYHEAVLNPTNPRDRATDWESDIVQRMREGAEAAEIVGERDTPTGRSLFVARPIRIQDPACLVCHSTVDRAPRTMVAAYGPSNGFGWRLQEIVGAQVVSVPMSVPYQRADRILRTFMLSLLGVFLAVFVILNVLVQLVVTRRIRRLSALADRLSLGDLAAPPFPADGSDEIGTLGESFNRMRASLVSALKMLGG